MQQVAESSKLINEISVMIEMSRRTAVAKVYDTLNMLFWNVGARTTTEILKSQRADYGKHILVLIPLKTNGERLIFDGLFVRAYTNVAVYHKSLRDTFILFCRRTYD